MNDNVKRILWTGGWDSTYRLVELSMRDIDIQPIYLEDPGRGSINYELNAINNIIEALKIKPKTKARFLPLKRISISAIPENEEVTKAYQFFQKETDVGTQHDWIARLALEYPMMELCIERGVSDHTPVYTAITKYGELINTGDGYIIDKDKSSRELNLLVGNLYLPILDKTEQDMLNNIKEWGGGIRGRYVVNLVLPYSY